MQISPKFIDFVEKIVSYAPVEHDTKMAMTEAIIDTSVAAVINIPLNFLMVWMFIDVLVLGSTWTSVIMTTTFTIYAVIRKTRVRMFFYKSNLKKQAKKALTT